MHLDSPEACSTGPPQILLEVSINIDVNVSIVM